MRDYFASPYTGPSEQQRRAGRVLGDVARGLLIAAAVILAIGGLVMVGFMIVAVVALNSWASNK